MGKIDRGWIMKVPHDERQPQVNAQASKSSTAAKSEVIASDDEADDFAGRAKPVVPAGPAPPGDRPSKFWQQFKDGDALWYYYEGPLGKWWCQDKDETPEPFI